MRVRAIVALGVAATLASCARGTELPSATPLTQVPPPTSQSPTAEPDGPSPEPLPAPVEALEHGGRYFAVYAAVGKQGSPELDEAVERLADLGIRAGAGELACDEGAAASLGVPPDSWGVGVYFDREDDAAAFAAALDPAGLGPVPVRTYCLD